MKPKRKDLIASVKYCYSRIKTHQDAAINASRRTVRPLEETGLGPGEVAKGWTQPERFFQPISININQRSSKTDCRQRGHS